ncbi:MAG: DNA primase [Candidatus Aenigmatarchaeota archaeon]
MVKISKKTIDEVVKNIRIEDVIGEYLKLHKVGRNYITLCPFHDEKTPSFVVSPEKQIYKCFGCSASGNVITFVREYLNLSFKDAVEYLAGKYSIKIEYENLKELPKESTILDEIHDIFKDELIKDKQAIEYLRSRGLTDKDIIDWEIGLARTKKILSLKNSDKIIQELKKINILNEKNTLIFENRIIFPVKKINGSIVGYVGRSISENSRSKYINSPNSDIFIKSKVIYGLDKAFKNIISTKEAIVVEGIFDVLALHRFFPNTVGVLTANITEAQANVLSKYAKKVILMFDNDVAGLSGTEKAISTLFKKGIEVKVVEYNSKDPDEAIKKEKNIIKNIKEAKDPVIKLLDEAIKSIGDNDFNKVRENIEKLTILVNSVSNNVLKSSYKAILTNYGIEL